MARIRLSGGIVLAGDQMVWLADDSGQEVDGSRPLPGAAVVVGPADASASEVARAGREARDLLDAGSPLVAAAGVDLGHGFRTARLEGGGETRRDAVLAALELLGPDGLERIGTRDAVVVALFGARATKRVGAAAVEALAGPGRAALRLAVAASDVLGPEQLEQVLRFQAPAGVDPVPAHTTALLSDRLTTLLTPYAARRRLVLVRSLWDEVVAWHASPAARGRGRRSRFSTARRDRLLARGRAEEDRCWRQQAVCQLGDRPNDAALLRWLPGQGAWADALRRAFQECVAATVLLRTAMAAEDDPVADAVLAWLDQLAYAGTAHVSGLVDRVGSLHSVAPPSGLAAKRAWHLASAVVLGSDPGGLLPLDSTNRLSALLRDACELAHAVASSAAELVTAMERAGVVLNVPGVTQEWRRLAGYSPQRDPRDWGSVIGDGPPLGTRLENGGDPAGVERIDDVLWLADLADTIAFSFGHDRAEVIVVGHAALDADPEEPDADVGVPSPESVSLAVAGVAQLVALGATAGPRPASWSELVAQLVADGERLGLRERLVVPADVVAWDGRTIPGTDLVVQVARTAQQLTEWGNFMGNCIGSYASEAGARFALLALRDPSAKLVANVSVERSSARWRIEQALGRFNEDLPPERQEALAQWAHELRVPDAGGDRPRTPAPAIHRRAARGRRHRRAPARQALLRASADLGDVLDNVAPEWALAAVRPIAVELGWAGEDDDRLGPFVAVARVRRPGPLTEATARALDAGLSLAEVWETTANRPLAGAVERLSDRQPHLRRLTDATVPPSLRLAMTDPRVSGARAVDIAARRIRAALFELLDSADPRLDLAVAAQPHTGFVATAVLATTASNEAGAERFAWIPVSADGALPGRPPTRLAGAGPWTEALGPARELGVSSARLDQVFADAPGRHLLVPAAWLPAKGWPAFWGRAHRVTGEVLQLVS